MNRAITYIKVHWKKILGAAWVCWVSFVLIQIKGETDGSASSIQMSGVESDVSRVDSVLSSIESRLSIIELNVKSITSDMREKAIEERNNALRSPPFTGGGNYPLDSF